MKLKFTFLALFSAIIFSNCEAQYGDIAFINKSTGVSADTIDVEIRAMPQDSVINRINGITFLHATQIIPVPANMSFKINFLEGGTSNVFTYSGTMTLSSMEVNLFFLYGDETNRRMTASTAYITSSQPSKTRLDFIQSNPSMPMIDLYERNSGFLIANDFSYEDLTFMGLREIDAVDCILDIVEYNNAMNGLYAYYLPASTLPLEYIFLFNSETPSGNDMYMWEPTGDVTKLLPATPVAVSEFSDPALLNVYPNPALDELFVECPFFSLGEADIVSISNVQGQVIYEANLTDMRTIIEVANWENGVYFLRIQTKNETVTSKFLKQ